VNCETKHRRRRNFHLNHSINQRFCNLLSDRILSIDFLALMRQANGVGDDGAGFFLARIE
jgi:hypothetical protein